jgi:cystathionine gamma-synthase
LTDLRFDSLPLGIGRARPASLTRPGALPIEQTAAYVFEELEDVDKLMEGREPGYMYTRYAGANQASLESVVAALEGAGDCLAVASGTAALLLTVVTAAEPGTEILATRDLYGGTLALFRGTLGRLGYHHRLVDLTDLGAVEAAVGPATRVLLAETISNPTMRLCNLERLAEICRRRGLVFVCDNTFASPYHCRPLEHGADLVVHSATKYLNGHGDVTAGVLCGPRDAVKKARSAAIDFGPTLDPFGAWLVLRGLRTLAVRMARQSSTALTVAKHLSVHPRVALVNYPGLPDNHQYSLAQRVLSRGFGGMLSFEPRGGVGAAGRIIGALRLVEFVPSLGDVFTTVSHPAKTSHRNLSPGERAGLAIGEEQIRLSVGLEDPADLIADLDQALERA